MAGDANSQIWLTHALNDDEVAGALTLCFSLKKVLTSRKVAVFVSPKVSLPLREALHLGFDFLFYLEEERNTAGLKNDEFAKLSALTLKSFEKIVFLAPTMMALKNSDEIFNECNKFQRFLWGDDETASIFVVRPCPQTFRLLMGELPTRNGNTVEQYLRSWTKNQSGKLDQARLGDQYCHALSTQKEFLLEKGTGVSLINIVDIPFDVNTEKLGIFSKLILENRKILFNGAVKPLLQNVMEFASQAPTLEFTQLPSFNKEPIAIVGMSCRFPASNNLEEFWSLLLNGEDGTGNPPDFRWRREQSIRNVPDAKSTNAGFLKCPVDDFDAKFFNISPKEMVFLDPQHRLLHELVWEGLEDAAIIPESLVGTNGGVFVGSWTTDYKDILRHLGDDEFYRTYMGNSIGASAARISHFLGMTGPSIATESGCSSAMVAVHLACKSLQRGETNFAIACGVNLLLHPFDKDLMPMVISPDGHCKTFDANANGFARGEGCGVLILKRLSDAVRDKDKIWALIRGSGMSQEGVSKSMGTPTVQCESLAMTEALHDARVDAAMVSYVEAHGTGTIVGDPMEVAAIAKAYHSDERKEPLLIGSVKTNVGHTESCSGITGIMKVVLAMQQEIIPPHRNFETLNPSIDLDAVPAKIPLEPVKWKRQQGKPRFAGVSSFGITGTDAHTIIEEPPTPHLNELKQMLTAERPLHIMKICAKSEEALDDLLETYKEHLKTTQDDFKNLAYTANIGRSDFSQRAVIVAKSNEDALQNFEKRKLLKGQEIPESLGKICFLFTGQGSQYPGMAKQLYETSPVFRMHFEYCEKILKTNYNIDITQVLWSTDKATEVSRTIYSQTSIFCVEYALLKLWESWGVKADYALGHSLGEFAAAVCSGILSVEDALMLVAERSRLIDELPRGKMLVIKADMQKVDTIMKKFAIGDSNKILDYAAVNSAEQTVVAGDSEVVLHFGNFCKENNLKCIVLEATHAFHSKHVDPMLDEYRKVAKSVKKLDGNDCKYISGMRGAPVEAEQVGAEYWVEHTREKVLFMDASKQAVELGCKTFIEIGPQPILSALTMMNNDHALTCLPSLKRNESEWETLLSTLGKLYVKGIQIDWAAFDEFQNRSKVSLPHYPFIGKKFWPDVFATSGYTIHPLLGSVLPNASTSKLFQSGMSLRSLDYVKDHAIGNHVIFPGSGYLELCLAAGLATVEASTNSLVAPSRPMKVENLSIQAPFRMEESKTSQLQTVVELNRENGGDWNDMKINIFRRTDTDSEVASWLSHAKATFSPILTAEERTVSFNSSLFEATLKTSANDEFIQEIYEKLATVGLKFGPSFRSLEHVWRDEDKCTLLAQVKVPSQQSSEQYILHPVVLDAMIQAIMMLRLTTNLKKKLYVPIKIGKFVWLSAPKANCGQLFIHAFDTNDNSDSSGSALLLDSTGSVLAVMSSVEFIATTVKAIESVLEQQTSCMPDLWEEIWKPSKGPLQHRLDLIKSRANFQELNISQEDGNKVAPHLTELFRDVETLVYLQMLRCLYDCGWVASPEEKLDETSLQQQLGILSCYRQYVGFILEVFAMEGLLTKESGATSWTLIKMPPPQKEIEELLTSPLFTSSLTSRYSSTPLLNKVGENLSKILKGAQPALNILFPEESQGYPSVATFYSTYDNLFQLRAQLLPNALQRSLHVKQQMGGERFIMKVLEIGAGTGSFTDFAISFLEGAEIDFEYTYTDISAAFFPAAAKKYERFGKQFQFKKLNIEEDPLTQGFAPENYDYVCASDVLHTTKNIKETLRNVRILMKPHAQLDIQEMTRVHRFITYLFGLLEGFWRFEDLELRPRHCTLTGDGWRKVLDECGFQVDGFFPLMKNYHSYMWAVRTPTELESVMPRQPKKTWLLFHQGAQGEDLQLSQKIRHRLQSATSRRVIGVHTGNNFEDGRNHFVIREAEEQDYKALFQSLKAQGVELEGIMYCWAFRSQQIEDQQQILRPYFFLAKSLLSAGLSGSPRLIGIFRGVLPVGETALSNFPLSTICGFSKSLKNENHDMHIKWVDVEGGVLAEAQLEEIFLEFWPQDHELFVAYREGTRFIPKLQTHKPKNIGEALKLVPGTDRFQLILPESKSISDLEFGPLDTIGVVEDEVEVQVRASALNFRDVLSVIKPSDQFKDINAVGFDLAGVVKRVGEQVTKWKVGDRVIGCNMENSALPSHVKLKETQLIGVPDSWTFGEAATIPAVYVTSVVCLLETAKITKEDVVLLHTATGGVGLSAIEICKHVGCTIIATAGSKRKQNYLRSLGIKHIFHSRNTKYGDQILELTNGRGVDVVLNSLTSEGFKEATLKACAKGARFIEMSKLNIWSEEEVKALRPDVKYTIVDVSSSEMSEWNRYMGSLRNLLAQGVIKPIPYVRFDGLHIREALQYMQKAKHIGKIVCIMPEVRQEAGEMRIYTPMFNSNSTYLITGGLGGIGIVVCEWMIASGAKHVLLASRSLPTPQAQKRITELNSEGSNIIPVQLDVSSFEQCRELLEIRLGSLKMPPLKGIMHAAGTIADGLISNLDWPRLSSVFHPKVCGTLNLHELTKNLNLEHFVMFSSMAALFGPPGQCNHAAGNSFEDALTHYRQSIGLPAMTINWGQWGEVGVATEIELPGIRTLSNLQGVTGLEYALKTQQTQLAVVNVSSYVMLSKLFPHLATYLDERIWKRMVASGGSISIKSDEFWQQYDSAAELEGKTNVLKEQLRNILRNTLKLDDNEEIKDDVDLQETGVDSLMFVEIKNSLQTLLGERQAVSASSLKDCTTVNLISTTLVGLIEGASLAETSKPTFEQVNELIREDSQLPQTIQSKPGQTAVPIPEIKTVLLTGCTGTLGPYVLKELASLPQIIQIVCLIRPLKKLREEERLRKVLSMTDLLSKVDMGKIRCVAGNLAEPHLGLEPRLWTELSVSVDAVFNCAASVLHTDHYRKRESTKDMRAVNITGTHHLLEFACESKLKRVYHASSLLAATTVDEKTGRLSENWPEVGDYDNATTFGYPVSKFVGDLLMKQAVEERGIPAKVFRFPLLVGESKTGRCSIDNNHALLRYLFIMKNKKMPSNPFPLTMLPVDTCANVSVRLFFEEKAPSGIYNMGHYQPDTDQEFVRVAQRFGYHVDIVDFSEFAKQVQNLESDDGFAIFKDFYTDEEAVMAMYSGAPVLKKWMEGSETETKEMWMSSKLEQFFPSFYDQKEKTMEFIYRDLNFVKNQGWFQKFGL